MARTDDPAPARVAELATWQISRLHRRAHHLLADRLADAGFRGYDYRLLAALDEEGPASQAALGQRTGLDRSDVATTVDRLAARCLVRRSPHPTDGRQKIVELTADGATQLESLTGVVQEVQDELLAPLGPSDRAQFLRLVATLLS
jgi:MarR family transcriptional regulator, lower aerobic nicotinate degradation pathway regulator